MKSVETKSDIRGQTESAWPDQKVGAQWEIRWGSLLVRAVPREGIGPGEEVGPFTMVNKLGYTGDQPQTVAEMLQHRSFVDVKLELKVKHRAEQWQPVAEFQIDRQLLTQ